VSVTVSLVRENGEPQFFISQIVNIDQRMELARQLDFKMSELELARLTLDARIKQLEHLNYTLAHNLRGPLKNFQLIAQALLSQQDPTADCNDLTGTVSEQQGLQMLAQGSKKLAEDLDQLLAVTSIRQNSCLELHVCDLRLMVAEVLAQHSMEIFEKRAEFVFNYDLEQVTAPRIYLASILYNLISNALKYVEASRHPSIQISSGWVEGRRFISVTDNGIGIDLNKFGHRLFQINQTFHEGYNSKGIGLFLAKEQAEAIGATLTVASECAKGSTFTIIFGSE
jgi:signal transduction histidine kinase